MIEIRVSWSTQLAPHTLGERHAAFPGPQATGTDEFDAGSVHVILQTQGDLAGYGRLTIGGPGVFNTWTQGRAGLPAGHAVADLGRCFITPAFRRRELFGPLCASAMMIARSLGCSVVNGACIPGRRILETLADVGFVPHNSAVQEQEPNGNVVQIQPLTCNDLERPALALSRFESQLAEQGLVLSLAAGHD